MATHSLTLAAFSPRGLALCGVSAQLGPASAGKTQSSWRHTIPARSARRPESRDATEATGCQSGGARGGGSLPPGARAASSNTHLQV